MEEKLWTNTICVLTRRPGTVHAQHRYQDVREETSWIASPQAHGGVYLDLVGIRMHGDIPSIQIEESKKVAERLKLLLKAECIFKEQRTVVVC